MYVQQYRRRPGALPANSWFLGSHAPFLPRGGRGRALLDPLLSQGGIFGSLGYWAAGLRCIGYLSCPSERASSPFLVPPPPAHPHTLIKTPHHHHHHHNTTEEEDRAHHHHHHHNTTEEEDRRADNTPSPPSLAALFVVGGGGGEGG